MSAAKSLWIISGQEFDAAKPILLILPVGLEIMLAVCSQERQTSNAGFPTSKLAVQERYNQSLFHRVLNRSLQGIAERPLPCNYNVILFVCALSRR
jgi:hypothetical protein